MAATELGGRGQHRPSGWRFDCAAGVCGIASRWPLTLSEKMIIFSKGHVQPLNMGSSVES
jgi:hypothetical protein